MVDGLDDEGSPPPEQRRKQLLQAMSKLRRIEAEIAKKQSSIANSRTTAETRTRLRAEIAECYDLALAELRRVKFSKQRIESSSTACFRELDDAFGTSSIGRPRKAASARALPHERGRVPRALAQLSAGRSAKGRDARKAGRTPDASRGGRRASTRSTSAALRLEAESRM